MFTQPHASSSFDDILGADPSPLDRPITITVFRDEHARSKGDGTTSLRAFAGRVHLDTASSKAQLPWLKLAQFGNVATTKGSFRNNANVLAIDGIEGDYDSGSVSIPQAATMLQTAGVAALLYSSPSHTPESPRWRVLCPLSASAGPDERERLCARLNGALGGLLAGESFTLSQSYYFGRVDGGAAPELVMVEGRALDAATELDATAIGRDGTPYRPAPAPVPAADNDDDDWDWQPAADWERIDGALAAIPVADADQQETGGRDMWLRVGQALHQVDGGGAGGFERWDEWSKGGKKYNARDQQRTWKSLGRGGGKRVRIGTLFDLAKRYGWAAAATVTPTTDDIDQIGLVGAAAPATEATVLRFLTPSECAATPSRGYVVKGMVAPRDLGCIFGAPGAGKSLIAPHIGYLVALGQAAFGLRTKAGLVFYVSPEDPHGMRGRITALKMRHGDTSDFVLVDGVSDLLTVGSPDLTALRAAVREQRPALIFLDTLAMAFPGLDENTAEDMGRVVAIGRSLAAHGAAVILIHHDTKSQGPTPRGHSLLNGALDMALQLFPRDESGIVRGRLTKNRNGTADRDIAFRIATEALGEDEDGDAITVAVVDELAPGSVPKPEKQTKGARAALRIYHDLAANGAVTEAAWREACVESRTVSGSEERKSRQTATRRAIQELAASGGVLLGDGLVRHPGSIGTAFEDDQGD